MHAARRRVIFTAEFSFSIERNAKATLELTPAFGRASRFALRAAEDRFQRVVVAFMAGKFIEADVGALHVDLSLPGPRPPRRILDRRLVGHRLGAGSRKALHEMQVFAGSLKVALGRKVRRVDDER